MKYSVRKARESDNPAIARAIAYSFEKIFRVFSKDMERMASVFENGIATERFLVAEANGEIIGIVACGDREKRVLGSTKEECVRYIGAIRGRLLFRVIRKEIMRPHEYPATTAYVDIAGVLPQARGKGVARALLAAMVENNPKYDEFILDVDSVNASAIKSYTDFGFVEYRREQPVKFINRARIFMKYVNKPN